MSSAKSFERLPTMYVKDYGFIPVVLTNAAFVIERNIKTKLLFQTQGHVSKINACLNQLSAPRLSRMKNANVHDVIEAMKAFLLRLPEPLLSEKLCESLITVSPEDIPNQYLNILTEFRTVSASNFAILHFMMQLLKKVSEHAEHNLMDVRKLATVFVLDVVKPLQLEDSNDGPGLIERMQRLPYLIMVVENLINQVDLFKIITSLKSVTHSPKGSLSSRSLAKSQMGVSPHASQSNVTDRQMSTYSCKGAGSDDKQNRSMNEECKGNETVKTDEKEDWKKTGAKSSPAMSEPQNECELDLGNQKRSVATASVCFDGVAAGRHSESIGDAGQDVKDGPVFIIEGSSVNVQEHAVEYPSRAVSKEHAVVEQPSRATSFVCPAGPSTREKRFAVTRSSSLRGKKAKGVIDTKRSPSKKRSSKIDHDTISWNSRLNRSLENKILASAEKKKRKPRTTSKKSKSEHEHTVSDNRIRGLEFTIFQPDEEITPWNEGSTNSDDSVMAKTIQNPRILACKAIVPTKKDSQILYRKANKDKGILISDGKMSKLLLPESVFRTISRQSSANTSESNDTTVSVLSYGAHKVLSTLDELTETPKEIVHISSIENSPISKELIRGVKLKGSIGVNTNPCFKLSIITFADDTHLPCIPERCNETASSIAPAPNSKDHVQMASKLAVGMPSTKTPLPSHPVSASASTLAKAIKALENKKESSEVATTINTVTRPPPKILLHPNKPQSAKNTHVPAHVRFNPKQLTLSSSLSSTLERRNAKPRPKSRSVLADWFVDIVLAGLTLCFTGFIFYVLQQSQPYDVS